MTEYAYVIFNENNERVSQFICRTKKDCQKKIDYWFGKSEKYKPVKVKIEVEKE